MTRRWVYSFGRGQADAGDDLKRLVGGKGASLAAMTRAGLNVPPGFTISTECCAWYDTHGQTWPDGLDAEVRAGLARLEEITGRTFGRGDAPLLLAVRSGAEVSMPGMMDTVLNVGLNPDGVRALARRTEQPRGAWEAYLHFLLMAARTVGGIPAPALDEQVKFFLHQSGKDREDDLDAAELEDLCARLTALYRDHVGHELPTDPWSMLCAAINAVFASWNSERAVTYRRHHHVEGLLGTAVNVQVMCPAEVAGVLFTADPIDPNRGQMLVESSYGLGEAIVLGKVTPDRFVLDKQTLDIRQRTIARKEVRVAALAEDGGAPVGAKDAASLTDEQVQDLARLGQRVEAYFGVPCDVEWARARGEFYLLQARAIKYGAAPAAPADDGAERERVRREEIEALRARAAPEGTVWSRFNLAEVLPTPTPMTWAVVRQFMAGQGGYGLMYRDLGFDPDPALDEEGVYDLICGRPYCNLSREPKLYYRRVPLEHSFARLKADPARASYPQATINRARERWYHVFLAPLLIYRFLRSHVKQQALLRGFADDYEQRIAPAFAAEVEQARREDWSTLSPAELLSRFEHWRRRTLIDFARHSLKPTALAAVALANLERTLAPRLQPAGAASPEAAHRAGVQRAEAALRELLLGVRPAPEADVAAALRRLRDGALSEADFLAGFGHRGDREMELARPRWSEDAAAVRRLRRGAGRAAPTAAEEDAAWQDAWQKLAEEAKIAPTQRPPVEAELRTLRRYLGLRETAKHDLLRGYALIRRALVELARRYDLGDGIFDLTPAELPRLVAAPPGAPPRELLELIAQRHRRRALALELSAPPVLFSDDLDALGRAAPVSGAAEWQGVPLSAGVAEAPALVLEDVDEAEVPDEPFILVCPSTDPAWVPLLDRAKGLVMETGGVLSHGAIMARHYNLPAVAGIAAVQRRLRSGQRLRVDGATGRVTVLT